MERQQYGKEKEHFYFVINMFCIDVFQYARTPTQTDFLLMLFFC